MATRSEPAPPKTMLPAGKRLVLDELAEIIKLLGLVIVATMWAMGATIGKLLLLLPTNVLNRLLGPHALVHGNGYYLTKHSVGIYSTQPPEQAPDPVTIDKDAKIGSDLKLRDVAKVLGESESAVESRIYRALGRLRENLD